MSSARMFFLHDGVDLFRFVITHEHCNTTMRRFTENESFWWIVANFRQLVSRAASLCESGFVRPQKRSSSIKQCTQQTLVSQSLPTLKKKNFKSGFASSLSFSLFNSSPTIVICDSSSMKLSLRKKKKKEKCRTSPRRV